MSKKDYILIAEVLNANKPDPRYADNQKTANRDYAVWSTIVRQ